MGLNVQKMQILAIFASYLASIVNHHALGQTQLIFWDSFHPQAFLRSLGTVKKSNAVT